MKTSSLRQVIVAMTIAVSAATVHGAWFSTTSATTDGAAVAQIRLSQWDHYQQKWLATVIAEGDTLRHSEGAILELRSVGAGEVALGLPVGLNYDPLSVVDNVIVGLNIPVATAANTVGFGIAGAAPTAIGTPTFIRLADSELSDGSNTPPANHEGPWSGPSDPTPEQLAAADINGSVGIHTNVSLSVDGDPVTFTWDIGRWAKGDVFLGLNEATYKVIDRDGNFKRFVATADYLDALDNDYTLTTGCATNWQTGEVFATNFGETGPAINVITRHPNQAGVVAPTVQYSPASRRFSTRVERPDTPGDPYGIDQSPESIVFDGDLNMYVGHSFGSFAPAPAEFLTKQFEDWGEYTQDVNGLPLEGWLWRGAVVEGELETEPAAFEEWGYVVDENGDRLLLAPQGTGGPYEIRRYGEDVSPRLKYDPSGNLIFSQPTRIPGLPDWPADPGLPEGFLSDPVTGLPMVTDNLAEQPYRWSMGKRLHRYNNTNSLGVYSPDDRNAFWTFTGRQGTDWIDLSVSGDVMYYTSEDAFIHRYNVATGEQLPDVGAALPSKGKLINGDYRFHGLRILPPGDGTGGFLVATRLDVLLFNRDGVLVQRYNVHDDPYLHSLDPDGGRVAWWYTLEVDPGGRTFWASAHDTGWVYQFDIATGRELKRLEAVTFRNLAQNGAGDGGRRVEGICVMWEYTAPQEICFKPDGVTPDGVDNDGDGFIDENCQRIEICSALSPGDDDGDTLEDRYDSDCSAEMPPVALDDEYRVQQKRNEPTTLLVVTAADGVIKRGDDDYDRDSDQTTLNVVAAGTNEGLLDPLSSLAITTAKGGSVVLQPDGSFVYTPDPEFHGADSFAYRISDGYPVTGPVRDIPSERDDAAEDDIATVTIIVEPEVTDDGIYQVWVGETVSRSATDSDALLANDARYPDAGSSGPVTIIGAWDPNMGSVVDLDGGTRTFFTDNGNRVTVNADGSFSFEALNLGFSGLDTFNYDVHDTESRSHNIATVTVNVNRPTITVTVPDQSKTYDGSPLPTTCTVESSRGPGPHEYTLMYTGTIRGGASYGPVTTAPTAAGTYTATCTHIDPALGPVTDTGTIVINPVPLTVTAADTTRAYLQPNPPVTREITGFVNGETESVLTGTTTCATSTSQNANVGTYPNVNTCSETLSATNYTFSYVPGDLTVTGFVLTVTASNTEKAYGAPNPEVTYVISGFQGDDDASVITGSTTCGTVGGPNAGTYPGANTCSQTLSATNYTFVYVPGTLVINKVPLVVTAATTTKVYGDPTPVVGRTITGFVNGDDSGDLGGTSVCSTSTSAGPNVGAYTDANVCTEGLTSLNYTFSYVPGDFSITPRPLTAKANDKTIVLGSPLPTLDGTLTGGVVTGDVINVTYTSTNSGTIAGTFPGVLIPTVTAGGTTLLTNYTVTEIPGTLIVLTVAPCTGNDGYTTYSQGGWGSKPSGSNPGALLARHFATVYGGGPVVIGGNFTLTFSSASAIEKFLPAGGTSKPLTASADNPTRSAAGNIAAQLLALRLATDFSAKGITKRGLGSLVMQSGPLAGRTVDEILILANTVVGGQPSALPAGLSISGLANILESLNLNYHEGTVNAGRLACTGGGTGPGDGDDPGDDDPGDDDPGDDDPGDDPPPPPSTGSGVCSGGVTKLVLKYIGTTPFSGVVYGQRTAPGKGLKTAAVVSGGLYTFATEEMGGVFESVSSGRLANNFTVFIGNTKIGDVHTSCSVPIYPGMKVGSQFEIVEVWSKGGGLIVRPPTN